MLTTDVIDRDDHRRHDRPQEAVDLQAGHQPVEDHEDESVGDQHEEAEGGDIDGQGQQPEDGADEGVQDAEQHTGHEGGFPGFDR